MGLERKLGLLFSTGLLSILGCAGGDTGNNSPTEKPVQGCVADYECKGERVCIEGKCIDNTKPSGNSDTVSAPDTKASPDTIFIHPDTLIYSDLAGGDHQSFPDASCSPQSYFGCHQGDVWWFDSCHEPHQIKESCDYGCVGGEGGSCKDVSNDTTDWDVLVDVAANYDVFTNDDIPFQETSSGCSGDEYACNDGKCIYSNWVCDGEADCSKGEDEKGCSLPQDTYTPPALDTSSGCNGYTCLNGECIPDSWLCDGMNDCSQGEDEQGCAPSCIDEPSCAYAGQGICSWNSWAKCYVNVAGCLEWSMFKECEPGTYCEDGVCKSEIPCTDECDNIYLKTCFDNKLFPCVTNYDSDDCLEWGEPSNCGSGQYCNDGDKACKPKPTDPDAGP